MCTSVASRVQGITGLPCSSEPWWLRMMCSTRLGGVGRGSRRGSRSGSAPGSSRAGSRRRAVPDRTSRSPSPRQLVGVELADVVQQRPGHRDVAVDAGERRRDGADRLGDGQAMLQQPVPVGLVVVLGGRGVPERGPRGRVLAEDRPQQPAQVRILDRGDSSRRSASIWAAGRAGPSSRCSRSYSSVAGRADRLDQQPAAVARVHGEHARRRARPGRFGTPRALRRRRSSTTAGRMPVRSPSVSLRYSSPSRRRRTSTARSRRAPCHPAAILEFPNLHERGRR